jgi:predicted nucleotidyltransferase component of viral defense system
VGGEELAASELLQKIILAGLSETDFFTRASFHGGTALRIFHGLNRYSQDLDFSLIKNEGKFEWGRYLTRVLDRMKEYGCSLEKLPNAEAVCGLRTDRKGLPVPHTKVRQRNTRDIR